LFGFFPDWHLRLLWGGIFPLFENKNKKRGKRGRKEAKSLKNDAWLSGGLHLHRRQFKTHLMKGRKKIAKMLFGYNSKKKKNKTMTIFSNLEKSTQQTRPFLCLPKVEKHDREIVIVFFFPPRDTVEFKKRYVQKGRGERGEYQHKPPQANSCVA